ncbi:nondiscriminating aspartyl-tRNA synthetase [Deinococcus metalli]|uniref:Aspartate--tRNA(Asp/Asn) ligase n=1 Tax=Deinococcus metalli TaxID=1141878 RepID=A0A7W8KHU8_9DEIO|nr:aspartate--tRNA(Asn) ligase [Deinococcus metalli]MBB5378180.1 nondiscriminating aspartyl-tRNA synthetase [Deinococcus metalli]GHF56633.1 aspartate--tRNA(Asp/Asn) ligase [Deinococcus metalli]
MTTPASTPSQASGASVHSLPRTLTRDLAAHDGQTVRLQGFVHARRDLGGVQFVVLRDVSGLTQCVGSGLHLPLAESSVEVVGTVKAHPKAPGGFEVQVKDFRVISAAVEAPPVEIPKMEWNVNPETMLDYRVVTVRGLKERAALRVQAELVAGFRDHLITEGFTEISTPKIVSAGAEGGANLFPIDYFGHPAFLAQSPQLYKQIMVGVFERVFEVAAVYRAEEHATSRHLNEYLSLDVEMGFITDEEDVMALQNRVLVAIMARLKERAQAEFTLLGATIPEVPAHIPRIPLLDARALVTEKYGHQVGGKDLDPEAERLLSQHYAETEGSDFVFVTKYPRAARPFYAHPDANPDGTQSSEITRGYDLLFRGIEITSGGQRIHDYGMLMDSIAAYKLNPTSLEGYTEVFKYGMPPHGGFAIGAERLTAKLLGISNVRYARAFPRDRHRLTP